MTMPKCRVEGCQRTDTDLMLFDSINGVGGAVWLAICTDHRAAINEEES